MFLRLSCRTDELNALRSTLLLALFLLMLFPCLELQAQNSFQSHINKNVWQASLTNSGETSSDAMVLYDLFNSRPQSEIISFFENQSEFSIPGIKQTELILATQVWKWKNGGEKNKLSPFNFVIDLDINRRVFDFFSSSSILRVKDGEKEIELQFNSPIARTNFISDLMAGAMEAIDTREKAEKLLGYFNEYIFLLEGEYKKSHRSVFNPSQTQFAIHNFESLLGKESKALFNSVYLKYLEVVFKKMLTPKLGSKLSWKYDTIGKYELKEFMKFSQAFLRIYKEQPIRFLEAYRDLARIQLIDFKYISELSWEESDLKKMELQLKDKKLTTFSSILAAFILLKDSKTDQQQRLTSVEYLIASLESIKPWVNGVAITAPGKGKSHLDFDEYDRIIRAILVEFSEVSLSKSQTKRMLNLKLPHIERQSILNFNDNKWHQFNAAYSGLEKEEARTKILDRISSVKYLAEEEIILSKYALESKIIEKSDLLVVVEEKLRHENISKSVDASWDKFWLDNNKSNLKYFLNIFPESTVLKIYLTDAVETNRLTSLDINKAYSWLAMLKQPGKKIESLLESRLKGPSSFSPELIFAAYLNLFPDNHEKIVEIISFYRSEPKYLVVILKRAILHFQENPDKLEALRVQSSISTKPYWALKYQGKQLPNWLEERIKVEGSSCAKAI